jgi:predicted amidophosphoribosyltransferase
MSFTDHLIGILAPHECLGCGAEGSLMCPSCLGDLDLIPDRCYRCRRLSTGAKTCDKCRKTSRLTMVRASTIYRDEAKELVWRLKFSGTQAAVRPMAKKMSTLLEVNKDLIIVPVPTATRRMRRRGYDQAKLLARELARLSQQQYLPCLR